MPTITLQTEHVDHSQRDQYGNAMVVITKKNVLLTYTLKPIPNSRQLIRKGMVDGICWRIYLGKFTFDWSIRVKQTVTTIRHSFFARGLHNLAKSSQVPITAAAVLTGGTSIAFSTFLSAAPPFLGTLALVLGILAGVNWLVMTFTKARQTTIKSRDRFHKREIIEIQEYEQVPCLPDQQYERIASPDFIDLEADLIARLEERIEQNGDLNEDLFPPFEGFDDLNIAKRWEPLPDDE